MKGACESGVVVNFAIGEGAPTTGRAGVLESGGSLGRLILGNGGLLGGVDKGWVSGACSPSSSPSLSSLMVGGRGCDASIPIVVLLDLGVERGGRVGLVGVVKEGVATDGSRLCGEEKEGRW